MELQPKIEPGSSSGEHLNLEDMSIQELVSVLRTAYLTEDFDRVEGVLVSRYKRLQTEILRLQEMVELEKLTRFQAEQDLRNREELCERGKKAQNNYEKLLKEVKKNTNLADRDIIGELRKKNNELELEVCELRKLKEKWVDDSNALAQLRIRVDALENEKNDFEDEENVGDNEIGNDFVETAPLQTNEPPSKRSKNAPTGASSSGMSPKKNMASKKQKTTVGTSRAPRPYDSARFLGPDQEARFRELVARKIWPEKKFEIRDHGDFKDIAKIIEARKWGTLVDPPSDLNYEVIREFYANALPLDEEPFTFTTMVRGRIIRFDKNAINEYLGNPLTLQEGELCAYTRHLNRGNWNIDDISRSILLEGRSCQLNASGVPNKFLREDMKPAAQVILLLILHNIRPKSHLSSIPLDTSYLLYYIMEGRQVDIARIIANELKIVAESGHKAGAKSTCLLVFPGLIMGLCRAAQMVIPAQVHETILGAINDAYVSRYCIGKRTRNTRRAQANPSVPSEPQPDGDDVPPSLGFDNDTSDDWDIDD